MTRQVYAIGVDQLVNGVVPTGAVYDPAAGSGGAFAQEIQGFTPKYALNQGPREVQQKNTMARMYVTVPQGERALFSSSIADPNLRQFILPRLMGPASQQVTDAGYMDFFLQQISCGLNEKYQVVEGLADNYVVYYFGQSAPVWQYAGELLNTVQDDQLSAWVRMYVALLRGTQLARRSKVVSLKYDNFIVTGTMFNTAWAHNVQNEMRVQFSFSLLVKRLLLVNTTTGWRPTAVNGTFATDPHLVVANTTSNRAPQAAVVQGAGLSGAGGDAPPPGQPGQADLVFNVSDPDVVAATGGVSGASGALPATGGAGRTSATNPNQNGAAAPPEARATQAVTGQPAEAQNVPGAPPPNTSTRPQDDPQQQVTVRESQENGQTVFVAEQPIEISGVMRNGRAAPRNLQAVTR